MENSSFLSASKRISAPIFLCFCGACSLCFFSCPKCPISALCSVLSKQLRQQNNQCAYFICLCVFVRACLVSQNVVEQNHWASHSLEHQSNQHIPLFLSLSHTHTHTLSDIFPLPSFFPCIYLVPGKGQSWRASFLFFPYMAFRCRSVFCYSYCWLGFPWAMKGTGGKCSKGRIRHLQNYKSWASYVVYLIWRIVCFSYNFKIVPRNPPLYGSPRRALILIIILIDTSRCLEKKRFVTSCEGRGENGWHRTE